MSSVYDYGECPKCGSKMLPIWYRAEEEKIIHGHRYITGRTCRAVSHLECPNCFHRETVDDSFDEPWR